MKFTLWDAKAQQAVGLVSCWPPVKRNLRWAWRGLAIPYQCWEVYGPLEAPSSSAPATCCCSKTGRNQIIVLMFEAKYRSDQTDAAKLSGVGQSRTTKYPHVSGREEGGREEFKSNSTQ